MKLEIKNIKGEVLFTHEQENNTIKKTLEEAVKQGAYLGGANLRDAYLEGADLEDADLYGANLRWADLEGANLEGAKLCKACLNNRIRNRFSDLSSKGVIRKIYWITLLILDGHF